VRPILDDTAVKVRLDGKATTVSLLVVIRVRADGEKLLLTVKAMGSESTQAWRSCLTISQAWAAATRTSISDRPVRKMNAPVKNAWC
jgi:transposase-like protein